MNATKFFRLTIGAAALAGAAVAASQRIQAPIDAPPTAPHVAPTQEENPLDTATPGLTPSILADNLIMTLKVKIVGQWREYGVFDIKVGAGSHAPGLKFPLTVDGNTYKDVYALSTQLLPLLPKQAHARGVVCDVVCWNPNGDVIGYDMAAYATHARQHNLLSIPPNQIAYIEGVEKLLSPPKD